ncbi:MULTISPECIES: hypothetical protein [unclassified Cupriavidus]|uniref:hypothetical protein n=1 Tax=unclassified Cupriavidus TaxID=2640874 RepID=UPI001F2B24E4|nr:MULTISPECIES: hypothetical protein [unclassified Cupriavidus]
MLTLTATVAYVLACIVAIAFGARWMFKNDPLLNPKQRLDTASRPIADDPPR